MINFRRGQMARINLYHLSTQNNELHGKLVKLIQRCDSTWLCQLNEHQSKWVKNFGGFFGVCISEQYLELTSQ